MTIRFPARLAARLGRSGLARNVLALGYGQAGRTALQFLSVPIFIHFWGLHDYGVWLLIFTIPSFLAMGDLGLNGIASNAMIAAIEHGNKERAAEIFGALRKFVLGLNGVLFALTLGVLALRPELVKFVAASGSPAMTTVLAVVAYGLVSVQKTTSWAGFRATQGFARITWLLEGSFQVESLSAFAVVALGGSLLHAALAYLAVGAAGAVLAAAMLRRHAPFLFERRTQGASSVMREFLGPSFAVMALPVASALSLQGTIAVLGAVGGPALVPLFTTTRTLTRIPVQLTMVVAHASAPLFTAAHARKEAAQMENLVSTVFTAFALIFVPALVLIGLGGTWFVHVWTRGEVTLHGPLLVLLLLSAVLYCTWLIVADFILSINRQAGYSYFFLAASLASLAATAVLASIMGVNGAALASVLLDLAMLAWVFRAGARLRIISAHTFSHVASMGRVRALLSLAGRKARS